MYKVIHMHIHTECRFRKLVFGRFCQLSLHQNFLGVLMGLGAIGGRWFWRIYNVPDD